MLPNYESLIIKYLTNSATILELEMLAEWIEDPLNKKTFKVYVETHYAIYYSMEDPDIEKVLNRLLVNIRKEKSFVYKLKNKPFFRYAAAVLVIGMMISIYLFNRDNMVSDNFEEKITTIGNEVIKPGTDKAILTLENGSLITLEKGKSFNRQNVSSNGKEIRYKKIESKKEIIKYNYLTVPRGGQFFVNLSDGTKVWLNSESKLKYPVNFIEGEPRQVELVYGEAYFNVSPSNMHGGADFKVYNKSQEVQVLGTEFNIKAYRDETTIYTTLVEGSIVLRYEDKKLKLIPNQQSQINMDNNTLVTKTVDVYNEISWKDGIFSFEDKSLKEIMKVLSRWYDMNVVFKNVEVEEEQFIGILEKDQEIEEILTNIRNFGIINEFKIIDKEVLLD